MMDAVKARSVSWVYPKPRSGPRRSGRSRAIPPRRGARSSEIAGKVVFQASDTTAPVPVDATILDVADEVGVFIDNACRSGTCASCRVKLLSGKVSMAVEDALTEQDKAEGYILACQAKIRGDVTVDA